MASLFIAGNGFDIAHGIPTSYKNFRDFIVELYPYALGNKNQIVLIEDLDNICDDEFAAEILLNTMDKSAGANWCNFEEALAYIDFNNKLPQANHKENETEEEDLHLMKNYLLYMNMLTGVFISCSKIWNDLFNIWIKSIQKNIDAETYQSINSLINLFSQKKFYFFTFNYTKTLQKIYNIKKVIHIHNRVGQKLIFGHGKTNITYSQFNSNEKNSPHIESSFLDDMLLSFKKDTDKPQKKYNDFFKQLNESITEIYSYGFSYSDVDKVYIKRIIEKVAPNATWYFTKFESQNKEDLRVKKIKLRRNGFKGEFGVYEG